MARQKLSPQAALYNQLQNKVRGSTSPLAGVSQVRGSVALGDFDAFVSWLPSINRNGKTAFASLFPRTIGDLKKGGALASAGLAREVAWIGSLIRKDAERLSNFIQFALEYEALLLAGQFTKCDLVLSKIEHGFGYSLWLIEARIALLQATRGLEAQKEYAESVTSVRSRTDIVAFLAHGFSQRNEPKVTPMRFVKRTEEQFAAWDMSLDFSSYLLFKMCNSTPINVDGYASILRHETSSSLIDQFETFVRLCHQATISTDVQVRKAFKLEVCKTAGVVDDERLRRAAFVFTTDSDWLKKSTYGVSEAIDSLVMGEHARAVDGASQAIIDAPLDPEPLLQKAEAAARAQIELPPATCLRESIVSRAQAVIGKADGMNDAVISLFKDGLNYRLQRFSVALDALVWSELSSNPRGVAAGHILAFMSAANLYPTDIFRLPTKEHRVALASLLAERYPKSASLHDQLIRSDIDTAIAGIGMLAELPTLPDDASLDASIGRALTNDDHSNILALAAKPRLSVDSVSDRRLKRYYANSLLMLNRIGELCTFIASECVEDESITHTLPIEQCVGMLDKSQRKVNADNIAIPILLDIFSKKFDDKNDDIRSYAYEDFLIAHNLERPSSLEEIIERFPQKLLIYYLRYVCIPDIMQVSTCFQGTRELEEERKNVLSLLVKLDSESAKHYETELREVTRAQLIHRGIRQVERSKIYVDIPAIRRIFEKKHRETFQRYQALVKAGIGKFDETLSDLVKDILSGRTPHNLLEVPRNEASDLLLEMIGWLYKECTLNPEHGLDCYLSMRIRHGTLSGQLRTPLEIEKLITQRAAGTDKYESNIHWVGRTSYLSSETTTAIDVRLGRFSADYDAYIANVAGRLIQIYSADRPEGLFKIELRSVRYRLWVAALDVDTTFEIFVDMLMELFWESVEIALEVVRKTIDQKLKPELTSMFNELEMDIRRLADNSATIDLDRALRTAQTGTLQALDLVKDWFRLSQPITEPNFPIEALIDVGLQCVRTIHRDFAPNLTMDVPPLPPFAGALVLFSDIFFIIFDNIRRHSGLGASPDVNISIEDGGDRLRIFTRSGVAPLACTEEAQQRMDRIKDLLASGEYQSAVRSEGGTGLIKLRKLTRSTDKPTRKLDFGFDNNSNFFVDFEIGKKEIQQ